MAKKTKSVHVDKYAPDAAEANKALIQLNKRWANRVVVDTMLPQKQPATAPNSQLEEPLAQWELDILNRPISTPSSDERPVIDMRHQRFADEFDDGYECFEQANYCKVCWLEAGDNHDYEVEQRRDNPHAFTVATPEEYARHKAELAELESFFTEDMDYRRFKEQRANGNTSFQYGT